MTNFWQDFKHNPFAYSKAIVGAVGGLVTLALIWGVIGPETASKLEESVTIIATIVGVYVVPNQRGGLNVDRNRPQD